ncbi:magnesium transporter [Pseudomonas sp. BN414]|uniref:magnesium transporter n=1 Tax=Pseudomonas sp. BN414 TaxID=2567888 RepID=UPI00245400F3|nr:magnesium transporter [Pseudomonas sp. BN414]MDH4566859.1 magnesium transporter [Pseudomonas sp. BN414]
MQRYYYISDNLKDLERVEDELEAQGIDHEQIHVLSDRDADVEHYHLHDVSSVMKRDMVHSGMIGVGIGVALAAMVMLVAWYSGWTGTAAGWIPFIFLAIALFGFSVWEGSLFGIQTPNAVVKRFQRTLDEGKHVFFVDVKPTQEPILARVVSHHPMLRTAGMGQATPDWAENLQHRLHQLRKMM